MREKREQEQTETEFRSDMGKLKLLTSEHTESIEIIHDRTVCIVLEQVRSRGAIVKTRFSLRGTYPGVEEC